MSPRFLRRDALTGAAIFRTDDGREVPVADAASEYARGLIQMPAMDVAPTDWDDPAEAEAAALSGVTPPAGRVSAPDDAAEASRQWEEATFGARDAQGNLTTAIPGYGVNFGDSGRPTVDVIPGPVTFEDASPAAALDPDWDPAWGPAPTLAEGVSPDLQLARQRSEFEAQGPGVPAAQPQPFDLTGGASRGAPRRAVRGRAAAGAAPQPDPLDALMVPPGTTPVTIGELAGGNASTRALDRSLGIADQAEGLAQRRADLAAQTARSAAEAEAAGEQRRAELENERRDAMGQARSRYQRALERVQAMSVEPNRFFQDGGNTIGAALAVALGAAGSAITGNDAYRSSALSMVQAAIDRDMDSQRANIANAQAGLEGEGNLLSQMRGEFQDREAAEEAARAAMLQAAARRAEELTANLDNEQARIQGAELRDQLIAESQAASAAAARAEEDRAIQNAHRLAQTRRELARAARDERRAMGGGRVRPVTTPQVEAADALMRAGVSGEQASSLAGLPITLPQAPVGTEQRGRLDDLDSALRSVEQMMPRGEVGMFDRGAPGFGLVEGMLPDLFVGDDGRRMRQRVANMIDSFMRVRSGANAPEAETQRMVRMVTGAGTEEELQEGIDSIRRSMSTILGRGARRTSEAEETDSDVAAAGGTFSDG